MTSISERARAYLIDEALPFWSSVGTYPNGCFVEHLDLAGRPVDPGFARVRVLARQLYVFSHAEVIGLYRVPGLTERAATFLIDSAWQGPDRGWAKLVDRDGRLLDGSSDLYDIAFALFALAWYYRLSKNARCLEIAFETLDFVKSRMAHPAGGYLHDDSGRGPRQQNPHMHLTEAMNAWYAATGEARFLEEATRLIDLYETRFTDPATGALGEFFADDWTPVSGPAGDVVEPGHLLEWTWIIGKNAGLGGRKRIETMRRSFRFAMAHGHDPMSGLTVDQVGRDGRILAASCRLWPQTETIKALIAAAEWLGETDEAALARSVDALFRHYLEPGPLPGTWIDHRDAKGAPMVDKVPTSSLYHIALAFFEILRRNDGSAI